GIRWRAAASSSAAERRTPRATSSRSSRSGTSAATRTTPSSASPSRSRPAERHTVSVTTVALPWSDLLEGEELAYTTLEPPRAPRTAPLPGDLHPRVRDALEARGIDILFAHQREAWERAREGGNV